MIRKMQIPLITLLTVAFLGCWVSAAAAQTPEPSEPPIILLEETLATPEHPTVTFRDEIEVHVSTGKIVHRAGQTVVVKVLEGEETGIHHFVLDSRARITRNGVPALVFDLRPGDRIVQTRMTTHRVPVPVDEAKTATRSG